MLCALLFLSDYVALSLIRRPVVSSSHICQFDSMEVSLHNALSWYSTHIVKQARSILTERSKESSCVHISSRLYILYINSDTAGRGRGLSLLVCVSQV